MKYLSTKSYLLLPVVMMGLFAGCTIHTVDPKPREQEITELLEAYYTTMSSRNWQAYEEFFWEQATLTTVWQTSDDSAAAVHISTIEEFILKTPEGPDSQPIFEEKMLHADVEVRDNLALAWVKYEAKFGSEDNLMEWAGTDLFTFMKHEDEWRIVSLVFDQD